MDKRVAAYLKYGHKRVEGWMWPRAAQMVTAVASAQDGVRGGVAEIGVHHGKLFILLYLLSRQDERAVAIDLFSRQEFNTGSGAGDLEIFRRNLERHADIRRLIVHEGDSTGLTATDLVRLGGGKLRLISIDGGHTTEITAHDLAGAEGALGEGGIIILDDCFNEEWPGVAEATVTYFQQRRSIIPFGVGANKTLFCHPEFARRYMDALRTLPPHHAERTFLGSPVVWIHSSGTLGERLRQTSLWQRAKRGRALILAQMKHAH